MTELKITIGTLNTRPTVTANPYWFTRNKKIHVSQEAKNQIIDLDIVDNNTVIELYNGALSGLISLEGDLDKFNARVKDIAFGPQQTDVKPLSEAPPERAIPASPAAQKELKKKRLENELSKILKLSATEIKKTIGGKLTESGNLPLGMEDIDSLNILLNVENNKKKPREWVINTIKDRIDAIVKSGIVVKQDEKIVVEEEEHKKIVFDSETQTFNEIESEQEKEKEDDNIID